MEGASAQVDQKWAPWKDLADQFRPGSMYEMLNAYARLFVDAIETLSSFEKQIAAQIGTDSVELKDGCADGSFSIMDFFLETIQVSCQGIELSSAADMIQQLRFRIRRPFSPAEVHKELYAIRRSIIEGLKERKFLYMITTRVTYHETSDLFGTEVRDRFRDANRDISEAGKCLALGRFTACVMHLMRVLEIGVRAFARKLRTGKYDRAMGPLLDDIDKKVNPRPPKTGQPIPAQKQISTRQKAINKKRNAEYGELLKNLNPMRQERNSVMHPDKVYTEEEARLRFDNTRAFMQGLIEILK